MAEGYVLGSGGGSVLEPTATNQPIYIDTDNEASECSRAGTNNPINIDISGNAATATYATTAGSCSGAAAKVEIKDDITTKLFVLGATGVGEQLIYRESDVSIQNNVLYGACWNDYAEFREAEGEPGQCVCEDGLGKLVLSTKRLQKGANIISDTFGFIIGRNTDVDKPIALAGRVLAFPDSKKIKVGDIVCAGKNGTISKMSRLEIILFPDRIIGEVSEFPTYDTWNNVKINDRIWIKIK